MKLICRYCGKQFNSSRRARKYCCLRCANRQTADRQKTEIEGKRPTTVLSYGGGIDSTAIALLIYNQEIETPEHIVMVDTGYEKQSTWGYICDVMQPLLKKRSMQITIIKTNDYSSNAIIDKKGMIAIPAHRKKPDGMVSKLYTWCNGNWKSKVINRWMRSIGIERAENWIGFSADEQHRKLKAGKRWISFRYPLIELDLTRADCIYYIGQNGLPMPPRTSCYFCPQQTNFEWQRMKSKEPKEFARAVQFEQQLQKKHPHVYLHSSCVGLDKRV